MAVSIRLKPDIEARLTALARATGRSKTFYIQEAIVEHLDDLEDAYLAEKAIIGSSPPSRMRRCVSW